MGQVAAVPFESAVEAQGGIREDVGGNGNAFASEARGGLGYEEALYRFLSGGQCGQSGINDVSPREAQSLKTGASEPDADPASDCGRSGYGASRFRSQASRSQEAAPLSMGPELFSSCASHFHALIILRG